MLPHRRHEDLIVREIDRELLVYDRKTRKTVCLNESAAVIWQLCDGKTSIDDLSRRLSESFAVPPDPRLIQVALSDFARSRLLDPKSVSDDVKISRREALAGVAGVPLALIPTVFALSAPTPAQAAASCRASGKACTANAQCCSKLCIKVKGKLQCK